MARLFFGRRFNLRINGGSCTFIEVLLKAEWSKYAWHVEQARVSGKVDFDASYKSFIHTDTPYLSYLCRH